MLPSESKIKTDLQTNCGLGNVRVELMSARNHLIYKIRHTDGKLWVLRMINPESYRKKEWVLVLEEFCILNELYSTALVPKVEWVSSDFRGDIPPYILQEFIVGMPLNTLKPLSTELLERTARAIAKVNKANLSPEKYPFIKKYVRRGYHHQNRVWYFRLLDAIRRNPHNDVMRWASRIFPVVRLAWRILKKAESKIMDEYTFHHDGLHSGNVFLRDGKIVFLDWDKVSSRNDPSFTLVRFATSLRKDGVVEEDVAKVLMNAYLRTYYCFGLPWLFHMRYLERTVSDLVWVLWNYARQVDIVYPKLEQATNIAERFEHVRDLIRTY